MNNKEVKGNFTVLINEFEGHAYILKSYSEEYSWNKKTHYELILLLDKIKVSYEKLDSFSKLFFEVNEKERINKYIFRYKEFSEISIDNILQIHLDIKQTINILKLASFNFDIKSTPTISRNIDFSNGEIFIVHGHDEEMKQSVARFVESKLNLKAIILNEKIDKGQTIIEKFVSNSKVSYAIVLISPDDKIVDESGEKFRARQNVIFELGYFIGYLGRERVCCLIKKPEGVEILSDYMGVLYKNYNDKNWAIEIAKELKALGFEIDMNEVFK